MATGSLEFMNVLVTGSNGFIGRNLISILQKAYPEVEISCLIRQPRAKIPGVSDYVVDYEDMSSLLECRAIQKAEIIFHVAGVTKSAREDIFHRGNVVPLENLLSTLEHRHVPLRRLVLVSSQAAGGPSKGAGHFRSEIEEDCPYEPYGISKRAAEQLLINSPLRIPFTIIRPSAVYGPYDQDFLQLFKMARSGLNIYFGNKFKQFSIIYVEDLVNGILNAALSESTVNKMYYLCNDNPVCWQDIHQEIFRVMNKRNVELNVPEVFFRWLAVCGSCCSLVTGRQQLLNSNKYQLSKPEFWVASNSRAKTDFGFRPQTFLSEGLKKSLVWYRESGWL